ncbi:hypothetical protein A6P39_001765 [Streptomyces sp. FXJ1.172]|uniref:hypothetical protein n=1 Tax=Streptomyces sp. FXJ1.172 TaxID=710705 RepID=UPI0013311D47|nr:hypothetical protein [Streptomyces sp. FXJ1.172]WEO92923.1 hypothetical protein A6P39_001765 [Streptomyces sp. FXJ1.172]
MAVEDGNVSDAISGGVFFHQVIQGRDITVVLPPKVTPALSGLPAPSPAFTGRDADVEELLHALAPREEMQAVPQSSRIAVAGLAGVGKTELVIQVAARALRYRAGSRAECCSLTCSVTTLNARLRFPRDAEDGDRGSDGSHERNIDHGCPQEVLVGVA